MLPHWSTQANKSCKKMDETHTIAAALPTADDDEQTQFHGRAPRPTAVTALEDLMPRELFIRHIMDQVPSDYPSLAVVNRSFNDTMCQPMVIMFRGATAFTSNSTAEAKKWYEIATERFPCREASICLSMLMCDNDESDLEKKESLLRSAIASESPRETYVERRRPQRRRRRPPRPRKQ